MQSAFNAKAQGRKGAMAEITPRMARISNNRFPIREIREIRGKFFSRQFLFESLRLCAFALKSSRPTLRDGA